MGVSTFSYFDQLSPLAFPLDIFPQNLDFISAQTGAMTALPVSEGKAEVSDSSAGCPPH